MAFGSRFIHLSADVKKFRCFSVSKVSKVLSSNLHVRGLIQFSGHGYLVPFEMA